MVSLTDTVLYIADKDYIYLRAFGQASMSAWYEVRSKRQTAAGLRERIAAGRDELDAQHPKLVDCLLHGIDLAEQGVSEYDAIRDVKAYEDELVPRPPRPARPPQEEDCRHGVSFAADCEQCRAEDE